MKHPAILALGFVLLACAPDTGPETAAVPETETAKSPYSFDVNLTLTPRAAEMLASTDEAVNVAAMYFGEPVSETSPGIDEHGVEIGLGRDDIEIAPKSALVTAPGTGFDGTYMTSVRGEPEVLINVYSARKTHETNLLDCGIYQGPISMAQKKPVEIKCDLIDGLNEDGDIVVETGTPGQ
ncbi:MAG TPA: hypothetical protein PLN33_04135 [Hyphomonadaceae bacterium]|jgi:hypothetical protein|nr:hypothetical protein [Hyphomonadaceae bacterium]HPN06227.1 hypothetical protein [Hyphomonadaceae bacterium]